MMNSKIDEKMLKELESKFDLISKYEVGTKEREKAMNEFETLYRMQLDRDRLEADIIDENRRRIMEQNKQDDDNFNRANQLKESKSDRVVRICLEVLGILVPATLYGVWVNKGFKFETEGTYTSKTFEHVRKFIRPKK